LCGGSVESRIQAISRCLWAAERTGPRHESGQRGDLVTHLFATAARTRIFISYRVDDTDYVVARLAEDLKRRFGESQVFHDIASIRPGSDFVAALREGLATCAVTLVVIGPGWLPAADEKGLPRLKNPDDWVRREVAESLQCAEVCVIPLLVGSAQVPEVHELPDALQSLPRRQALPLTSRHWHHDVEQLIGHLVQVLDDAAKSAIRPALTPAGHDPPTLYRHAGGELLSAQQEHRMRQLINVLETGETAARYDWVSRDQGGGLAYGIAGAARERGDLAALLRSYAGAERALHGEELQPWLAAVEQGDPGLDRDDGFIAVLLRASRDPLMQDLQEQAFFERCLRPAFDAARKDGIHTPLGVAVLVDSFIHGSWKAIRERTAAKLGGMPGDGVDERAWIRSYLEERRDWLGTHQVPLLRTTRRRPQAFLELVEAGNRGELQPPISVSVSLQ
jgi:hypothetical protein